MAGPLTEAEELELLELELEEAQARVRPAAKSPFLQRGMGMVQGAMATPKPRPVSRMEAASLGAQRGGSFATADEAEGVRNALNMIPQAPGPIGSLTNFAMGLGGMALEALPGQPPQSYTQGRDALRAKEEAARAQHPVTFGGSEIAASVLVPVGGTARAATKTGQVIKGTAAGAGSGAVYSFAAEDGSLEERAKAGATGGVVGGAFGGLLSTVIPRDIPLSDVLNTELFGTKVSRPVLKTIERMLVDAGVPANRVEAGVVNIRQRLQSGQVGAGLPTRFKDELVKEFGDSARGVSEAIETQIRGGAARSGSASDTAVRRAVSEDNAAARELFSRSVDQFAGSTSRPELRGQAIGQLEEIVESRYKPILAAGIADPAKQQALVGVLAQPRMQSLASELAEDAEREGIDLAALIARNPAEAAHWMQSKARQLADDKGKISITGRVIPDRTMSNRRQDILNALEDAVPGYRETRKEYGDKFGVMQAMNFAKGFLTRAKDDVAVADMAEEFADMSEAQKQMALASLRSVVTGSAENVRYVDPELATGALRTAEIGKEPVLKALSEVFGDQGTKLADDIKAIVSRTDANRRINPQATGSDTVPKAQAIKKAIENTRGPVQRFVGSVFGGMPLDVGASMVAGVPAPLASARAGIQGAGKMADNRAMSTVDKVTELLLSQPQAGRTRNALASPGTPPTGGGQIIDQLPQVPPGSAPAPRTVGVAPATAAMPTPAPVPPSQPPAMAAPVMPPPAPAPSPAPAPARSGPPPFPPPLEAMEWTGPIPREPGGLLAFIRKLGGIREEFGRFQEQGYMRGSVAQFLGDVRSRPGLLNNKSGQTIDELARSARDAGFDIGDDEDFMRQLGNELQGRGKSYRIGEAEEWNAYQDFLRDKTRAENSERVYDEIPFGFGRTDATNALAGGTLGGIAPAESPEERARNMAIGAGIGGFARRGSQMLDDATRTVGQPRATSGRTVGQGGYFGRQSLRPPGSGPSPREIETQQQWATATPIVTQARTTAQSAQQAADAALQSKAPADIARAKDQKKALVSQLQEAQASRAGMDTPEDARLAETLASLTENTSDPVLLSTQISAAKTSLDRLLTDIGSPSEGNLIPVRTNILTRTQAPRSAAEGPQDRASVTRYAEGSDDVQPMGFGASVPPKPVQQAVNDEYFNLLKQGKRREALRLLHKERGVTLEDSRINRGGAHSPPSASDGAPGYDVASNGIYPDDLYSANGRRYYGTGDDTIDGPAFDVIRSMEANPNKMITIYRSVEKGASGKINPGDWVTTVRKYAKDHGEANIGGDYKIIKKTVAARDIFTDGNSIAEWGYSPQPMLPSHRGAYTEDLKRIPGEWKPVYGTDDDLPPIKGMGFGAGTPKTPQQAVRFETPGSPEYEAAVAKGLDMSQAGRMGRAKEMGFDTETVLYHGTPDSRGIMETGFKTVKEKFGVKDPDRVYFFAENKKVADTYADDRRAFDYQNATAETIPVYLKSRNPKIVDWGGRPFRGKEKDGSGFAIRDYIDQARADGHDSVIIRNVIDTYDGKGKPSTIRAVFDPSNIRSVNAAFDPEKSGSSTLLAAAPFAAVGGAGLTLAGEDARNQRTVGKPKTSQSARTVGKAKTN
jgi:hypothetical protein